MRSSGSPVDRHIGARLRQARRARNMTLEQLAEAVGLTYQQVQKYETGANRIAAGRLYEMGQVLDVTPAFFFQGLPLGEPVPVPGPSIIDTIRDEQTKALVVDLISKLQR